MAAGDVSQFVGDHALQLIDVVGPRQEPAVNIDDLSLSDESVDRVISQQGDPHALWIEPGRFDQGSTDLLE